MATPPTNSLVRVAEQDTTLPIAGGPNKIVPATPILNEGFDKGNKAFAQNFNYILDNIADWVQFSLDETSDLVADLQQQINDLDTKVTQRELPIGATIELNVSTNPATLFGYGTWVSFGDGLTTVGVGSHTDDRGELKTWTNGQIEGEYRHVQTTGEIATHDHTASSDPHTHRLLGMDSGTATTNDPLPGNKIPGETDNTAAYTNSGTGAQQLVEDTTVNVTVNNTGSSDPMNNTQPSIAVYRWIRTL